MAKCKAKTKKGVRCRNDAKVDGYCHIPTHAQDGKNVKSRAKYDPEMVAEVIKKSDGNLSEAARVVGMGRQTIDNYCERYEVCAEAKESARKAFVDLAESSLRKQVKGGEFKATRFVLRCWGRKRGWVEKKNLDITTGGESLNRDPLEGMTAGEKRNALRQRLADLEAVDVAPKKIKGIDGD